MEVSSSVFRFDQAVASLCASLQGILAGVPASAKQTAFEVRLRVGAPIALTAPGGCWFVDKYSRLHNTPQSTHIVTENDITESVVSMCSYSVHSHQNELKNGFISLVGGHRAGVCGTAVREGDQIRAVREVTSINLRIARDVRGAADAVMAKAFDGGVCGLLIAGIPSSGKTTVLRDLARQLSSGRTGRYLKVAVVDERCELGAVCDGIPQNDLGVCCDILSGYPKGEGIQHALRTLSPQVILCDEIGGERETDGMLDGINCGVQMIATAHAERPEELLERRQIRRLLENGAFKRVVQLGDAEHPGQVAAVMEVGDLFAKAGGSRPYTGVLIDDGSRAGRAAVWSGFGT